jgi:RHS repeat-associated protein
VRSVNGYDSAGRLVNLTHSGRYWTLAAYTYTLDAVGNRLAVTERVLPPTPFNYLPVILKDFAGSGEQMLPGEQTTPFVSPLPFQSPLPPISSAPPHHTAAPMFDPSLLIIAPIALAAVVARKKGRKGALFVAVLTGALVIVGQTHTSGALPAPMPFLSPQSPPPGCTLPAAIGDTRVISYTYDPLYRLSQAAYSSGECYQYGYDRVGNRTAMTTTIGTTTYQYDPANRLTNAGGVNYTWDNNGNLINDGSSLYRYDRANRLISTTLGSATTLFSYNGDGVRLKQIVAGTVTTYTQDVAAPLPVVLQAKTSITTTKYLYSLGTRPLAQNATAWEYLLPDALGSVRQIASTNGYINRTQDYEPYGSVLGSSGSGASTYGFTGEERDQSGLIFLRARYMQPRLGIFLARDPWSGDQLRPGSLNGYSYVEGNPVNAADPTGLRKFRIWASAFIPQETIEFPYPYTTIDWLFGRIPFVQFKVDPHARFEGDGRSFAWGNSATVFNKTFSARVWHEITIETDPIIAFDPVTFSDAQTGWTIVGYTEDHFGFGLPREVRDRAPFPAKAAVSREGCTIKIAFMASASNPLIKVAPTIDYAYYLRFDLKTNELYIAGYYDKFPAHELYVASDTGVSLALVQAMPSGVTQTPLDLASLPILIQPVTVRLPPDQNGSCGCQ